MDRIGNVRVQGREDREGGCQVCLGGQLACCCCLVCVLFREEVVISGQHPACKTSCSVVTSSSFSDMPSAQIP
jgi:hypothetical protein